MNQPQQHSPTTRFKGLSMRLIRAVIAIAILASTSAVRADLISPVAVSLIAPGGTVSDPSLIDVDDTVEKTNPIEPGDGTNIGGYMLPGEYIKILDDSILLRVASGGVDGAGNLITGYLGSGGQRARYVFAGLGVLNATIVGFSASATGITAPASTNDFIELDLLTNTLSIYLDSLVFLDTAAGQSDEGGDIEIELLTRENPTTVPEPASLGIVLIGLAGLGVARRRTAAIARRKSND